MDGASGRGNWRFPNGKQFNNCIMCITPLSFHLYITSITAHTNQMKGPWLKNQLHQKAFIRVGVLAFQFKYAYTIEAH